jgi:hypothetical protein
MLTNMLVEEPASARGAGRALAAAITRLSRRWVAVAVAGVLTAVTLALLQALGAGVEELVGFPPFDLQTPLALDAVLTQAPLYAAEARAAYAGFLLVDTVFPLAASVLLAFVLAWSVRALQRLRGRVPSVNRLVLLPLVGALFDWLENIFFALAIWNPESVELWAQIAVVVKGAKVAVSVTLISGSVLLFAAVMVVWSTIARLRTRV